MAKSKKYDAPQGEAQSITAADVGTMPAAVVTPAEGETAEAPTPAKPSWYLKNGVADPHGRTDYRFAKYAGYPKKPSEVDITIDGEAAKMAVTSSGGWADESTKGYNGYIQYAHPTRGLISGWILFGHGVDPRSIPLDFTTVDGTCDANPKRLPANPETEEARKAAFKAAMDKKKAEAAAANPPAEGEAQLPAEAQPTA